MRRDELLKCVYRIVRDNGGLIVQEIASVLVVNFCFLLI